MKTPTGRASSLSPTRDRNLSATLDIDAAIDIFRAKNTHTPRDGTSAALAAKYGITPKAVRDIWNLRTWAGTTRPFWTRRDEALWARKRGDASTARPAALAGDALMAGSGGDFGYSHREQSQQARFMPHAFDYERAQAAWYAQPSFCASAPSLLQVSQLRQPSSKLQSQWQRPPDQTQASAFRMSSLGFFHEGPEDPRDMSEAGMSFDAFAAPPPLLRSRSADTSGTAGPSPAYQYSLNLFSHAEGAEAQDASQLCGALVAGGRRQARHECSPVQHQESHEAGPSALVHVTSQEAFGNVARARADPGRTLNHDAFKARAFTHTETHTHVQSLCAASAASGVGDDAFRWETVTAATRTAAPTWLNQAGTTQPQPIPRAEYSLGRGLPSSRNQIFQPNFGVSLDVVKGGEGGGECENVSALSMSTVFSTSASSMVSQASTTYTRPGQHFLEYSDPVGCDMGDEEVADLEMSYKMTREQGQEQDASEAASLMPVPASAGAGRYDAVAWALDRFF
jgi:hypothetical protein